MQTAKGGKRRSTSHKRRNLCRPSPRRLPSPRLVPSPPPAALPRLGKTGEIRCGRQLVGRPFVVAAAAEVTTGAGRRRVTRQTRQVPLAPPLSHSLAALPPVLPPDPNPRGPLHQLWRRCLVNGTRRTPRSSIGGGGGGRGLR